MCSQCEHVEEDMSVCPCFRAWYCNAACQLQHWAPFKPNCNVCLQCERLLNKVQRCARCMQAKYCDAECQAAHWSDHKKDCAKK